ncbi:MAG: uracil-DNA glycosylase family protein [Deltaproteobacteria bacterium]|nr:uracil-DNA glycosylase family protein [Deltaproteobacteria bacterium]
MSLRRLLAEVRACEICAAGLPVEPNPILQADARARILVAGQAPGRRAHEAGVPFRDPSGDRLRTWMGIDDEVFYDARSIAIIPMGFCYPGTGRSGDLPPRAECAPAWREKLLAKLPDLRLTLVIGAYAQAYHLEDRAPTLAETVGSWREGDPKVMALPHPSPRNQGWFKRHPWFEDELLPVLRRRVKRALA